MRTAALFALLACACPGLDWTVRDHDESIVVSTAAAPVTVLVFVSVVCPISDAYVERLNALYSSWKDRGVRFAFVDPNINELQANIDKYAKANGLAFPIYTDPGAKVAAQLKAQMTPEVFVFDRSGAMRYHGRIDDAVNPARVRSHDLRNVLEALLEGRLEAGLRETRAFGCTIKRSRP
jgi:hypothetical protein